MFNEELKKIEDSYPLFTLEAIRGIKLEKIDIPVSKIQTTDDFIIIQLRGMNEEFCSMDIYLGINTSANRYGFYLNGKAIVYNYEKFETYKEFDKELFYFLSCSIEAKIVADKNSSRIYTDYHINAQEGRPSFSFREYHKENWSNFLGLKKTSAQTRKYSSWL